MKALLFLMFLIVAGVLFLAIGDLIMAMLCRVFPRLEAWLDSLPVNHGRE